jgi:hypothetical protein
MQFINGLYKDFKPKHSAECHRGVRDYDPDEAISTIFFERNII